MLSSRFSAGRPGSITSPVSPQVSHASQAHKEDDDSDVSPLSPAEHNDLSSISGFPQFSGFNFDIDSEEAPPSPTGERRPSDSSTLQLIPRAVPPVIAIVTSTALPGGVHREAVAEEVVADPPPPYTRYDKPQSPTRSTPGGSWASRAARIAMITQQPSQPSPVYAGRTQQHRNQRFASAAGIAGGLTRQQTQRTLHPLTLQDLAGSGYGTERMNGTRSAAEAGRTRGEAAVKRKGTWRGRIFCPSGGCFGLSESRGNGEKRGLTKKGKYCVVGMIIAMAIVMIIVGAVVGTQHNRTRRNKGILGGNNKDLMETVPGFPPIPTGLSTIKSQGKPEALTTCVSPPSLWSCDLPPDSRFPSTITSSGDGRVPEFRFTIKIGNDSTNQAESLWTPVPSNIPNVTDYAQLGGSVDGVMSQDKAGEETPFYISLETNSSPSSDRVKIQSVNTFSSGSATILKRGYRTFRRHALLHPRQDLNKQPANIIPEILKNQPLRLFDRDLETEHYGFHIYYQKSIYVSSINSSSSNNQSEETTETPGGVLGKNANFVVNWEKTRFKVTIWTKIRSTGTVDLIDENNSRRPKNDDANKGFPYAVSISEDRTGGDPRERGILSYPVRDGSRDMTGKMGIPEKKGVNTEVRGCFCEWKNWRESM